MKKARKCGGSALRPGGLGRAVWLWSPDPRAQPLPPPGSLQSVQEGVLLLAQGHRRASLGLRPPLRGLRTGPAWTGGWAWTQGDHPQPLWWPLAQPQPLLQPPGKAFLWSLQIPILSQARCAEPVCVCRRVCTCGWVCMCVDVCADVCTHTHVCMCTVHTHAVCVGQGSLGGQWVRAAVCLGVCGCMCPCMCAHLCMLAEVPLEASG